MRVTLQEQLSQIRMAQAKSAIFQAFDKVLEEYPDVTYVELASALLDCASRQLMHQRRAEVKETEQGPLE